MNPLSLSDIVVYDDNESIQQIPCIQFPSGAERPQPARSPQCFVKKDSDHSDSPWTVQHSARLEEATLGG